MKPSLNELSLGGVCVLTIENSIRLHRNITFCYPSLMKCWNGLQTTLSFVSLMVILDITKSQSSQMTKKRLPLHAPIELMHIDECRSDCAVLQLLSNGA